MAGDWILVRMDLHDDPAVIRVAARTGRSQNEVVGAVLRLWAWANAHTADGVLAGVPGAWLDAHVGLPGFCEAMAEAGWLRLTAEAVEVPNFGRYNGSTAKARARGRVRAARHRGKPRAAEPEAAPPEPEPPYAPPGDTLDAIRGTPPPRPVMACDRPDLAAAAKRLVTRFDGAVKSAHASKVGTATSCLVALLAEGHSEQLLAAVIDLYARQCEERKAEPSARRPCHKFFDRQDGSYLPVLEAVRRPKHQYVPPAKLEKI